MDLSVVIITHNRASRFDAALRSVFAQESRYTYEVIAVLNGCQDDSRKIASQYSLAHCIENPLNRGVAKARNQGIRLARGKWVMMLDDDAVMQPGCIENAVNTLEKLPNAWGAGTRVLTLTGELEYSARTFYSLPVIFFRRTFLGKRFPDHPVIRAHLMKDWDHSDTRPVDWVSGASLILSREAIGRIGAFDEGYFFGFEDVDWCFRVKRRGGKIFYLPEAVISHEIQGLSRNAVSPYAWRHFMSYIRFSLKKFLFICQKG